MRYTTLSVLLLIAIGCADDKVRPNADKAPGLQRPGTLDALRPPTQSLPSELRPPGQTAK